MEFAFIEDIRASNPDTYWGKVFLSFDLDWCCDEVLADTHQLCVKAGAKATYFVTNYSEYLDVLDKCPLSSVGIHPNFIPLLRNTEGLSVERELERLKDFSPDAKVARSHGVVQGGVILKAFSDYKITHDSNDMIPIEAGFHIKPYETVYGITKVPFSWADEHEWSFGRTTCFSKILRYSTLLVFDFHPIHVFLNTDTSDLYESTRSIHRFPKELIKYRFTGHGTRSRLVDLLNLVLAK